MALAPGVTLRRDRSSQAVINADTAAYTAYMQNRARERQMARLEQAIASLEQQVAALSQKVVDLQSQIADPPRY